MKKITLLFICLLSVAAFAQPGSIDSSFNSGAGTNDFLAASTVLSNNKILICGGFNNYNGTPYSGIARLNADGTIDTTFNTGGLGINNAGVNYVYALAIQSDGKIVIGGAFQSYNGVARTNIARLNADGTLDASFDPGTGTNSDITSISIQADQKIIIAGYFSLYNGIGAKFLARINTDGTRDTTFNTTTGGNDYVFSTAVQTDGQILIGGGFTSYKGTLINRFARLNTDGSLDTSFAVGTGSNNSILKILIQPDNQILIGGYITDYNGSIARGLTRVNTNGTRDTSFDSVFGTLNGLDLNFNSAAPWVHGMALQADGKIVIGGNFTLYNLVSENFLTRLNANGTLDTGFTGTGPNFWVYTVSLQSDGKIIAGGYFSDYDGTTVSNITRINAVGVASTIDIASISAASPYCPAQALTVNYSVTGSFTAGNVFTAQLSDALGSFAAPVSIGTITSTNSGAIAVTIPGNTAAGSGYRIRVVSATPAIIGNDNGSNLVVNAQTTYYQDADLDGYGNPAVTQLSCIPVAGYVLNNTDCNDANGAVNPGAIEIAYNLIDDNCNGSVDEGFPPIVSTVLSCNYTLAKIDSYIYTSNVAGAQGYRWRVTTLSGPNVGQVQFINTALRVMRITALNTYAFNTTYKAEVSVKFAGFYQPFTPTECTMSTPAAFTQLINCGATLTSLNDIIYANLVPFAAGYRFKISDPTGTSTEEITRSLREFRMSLITGFTVLPGKTYNVEVAVKNADGSYLSYGSICTVTTPSLAREIVAASSTKNVFGAVAYPNPFAENVNIDLTSASSAKVSVKVYDMTGRILENLTTEVTDLTTIQIGDKYPTGVYNVIVSQGDELKLLRIVKR